MIQRIQTIYLFLAALLTGSLLKLKLAEIIVEEQLYVFYSNGIFQEEKLIQNGLPIKIFILLILLLHLTAIFSFKRRIRQIRMIVFTEVLLLGLIGIIFYFAYASFDNLHAAFKIPVSFPLIAAIFDYLAIRAIGRDEVLVRSVDRIRSKRKQ